MSTKRLGDIADILPQNQLRNIETFAKQTDEALASPEKRVAFDREMERNFLGGFTHRDEANALIAMAVRNGPLETLHAGKYSELLEDDALSRLTDDEIKTVMIYATRMLATLLKMRDKSHDVYRRYIQTYGDMYCHSWERNT